MAVIWLHTCTCMRSPMSVEDLSYLHVCVMKSSLSHSNAYGARLSHKRCRRAWLHCERIWLHGTITCTFIMVYSTMPYLEMTRLREPYQALSSGSMSNWTVNLSGGHRWSTTPASHSNRQIVYLLTDWLLHLLSITVAWQCLKLLHRSKRKQTAKINCTHCLSLL